MSIAGASIKPHHFSECLARRMAADIIKGETDYSEQGLSPHPFWKDGDTEAVPPGVFWMH
jgi:hypothetical protein